MTAFTISFVATIILGYALLDLKVLRLYLLPTDFFIDRIINNVSVFELDRRRYIRIVKSSYGTEVQLYIKVPIRVLGKLSHKHIILQSFSYADPSILRWGTFDSFFEDMEEYLIEAYDKKRKQKRKRIKFNKRLTACKTR